MLVMTPWYPLPYSSMFVCARVVSWLKRFLFSFFLYYFAFAKPACLLAHPVLAKNISEPPIPCRDIKRPQDPSFAPFKGWGSSACMVLVQLWTQITQQENDLHTGSVFPALG